MKKILFLIFILTILIIGTILIIKINNKPAMQKEILAEQETEPSESEKAKVAEWLNQENPKVQDEDRLEYDIYYMQWNKEHGFYDLWDTSGTHLRITSKELLRGIKTHRPPIAQITSVQIPIPVPLPTQAPIPTPTPVPSIPITTPKAPTPSAPTNITIPTPMPANTTTPAPQPLPANTTQPGPSIPASCGNQVWDGDESDLDCGGSCYKCPPANQPTYLSCWDNNDCASGNCDMTNAQPLPAIDPNTGTQYNINQVRTLAGHTWIIPWQGRCG